LVRYLPDENEATQRLRKLGHRWMWRWIDRRDWKRWDACLERMKANNIPFDEAVSAEALLARWNNSYWAGALGQLGCGILKPSMGNSAQHAEDEEPVGCQPRTWCQPEEPAHCPSSMPCCQEGGFDRMSFGEIRRLIRAGNSLATDEDMSNIVVTAAAEVTEQQAAKSRTTRDDGKGRDTNNTRSGKSYAHAISFASVESFGTVPLEHTSDVCNGAHGAVEPPSPSSGSMWSLNTENHINVNMTVCEGVEEALRVLRTPKGMTEVPGQHNMPFVGFGMTEVPGQHAMPFVGFVEVGSLSESSSDQGFNAVSDVPEGFTPAAPDDGEVRAKSCPKANAITARSCSDVVPLSGG